MPRRPPTTAVILVIAVVARLAAADPLLDGLATDDPRALAAAVEAIERAPTAPELADTLYAAARACEDRLLDPARALAIYERILTELPHARVAAAAQRRAAQLRATVGAGGEHAARAAELARVIAGADALPLDAVIARATALADAPWPGAPDAALWLAEHLRRLRRHAAAQARYALVTARWPASPQAGAAVRGGAGNAIEAGAWDVAETLARQLPATDPGDRIVRDDLLAAIAGGRLRSRLYLVAWIVAALVLAGLLGSLAEAVLRGGRRLPSPRPPLEVWFLVPLGLLVLAIAYVARPAIAPTVTTIVAGGLVLAWISGMTLDLLRARGRALRLRASLHVAGCAVAVVALGYISVMRHDLIDLLVETIRSGPEG